MAATVGEGLVIDGSSVAVAGGLLLASTEDPLTQLGIAILISAVSCPGHRFRMLLLSLFSFLPYLSSLTLADEAARGWRQEAGLELGQDIC